MVLVENLLSAEAQKQPGEHGAVHGTKGRPRSGEGPVCGERLHPTMLDESGEELLDERRQVQGPVLRGLAPTLQEELDHGHALDELRSQLVGNG